MSIYTGVSDTAKKATAIYAGVNGTARKIVLAYAGDENGVARLVYSSGILPSGYQQVEWLESSGTQYINTGVYFSANNIAFEVKFVVLDHTYTTDKHIMGMNHNGTKKRMLVYLPAASAQKGRIYSLLGNGAYLDSPDDSEIHTFKLDLADLKVYKDGVSKSSTNGSAYSRFTDTSAYWIGIFSSNQKLSNDGFTGRIFSAKIWQAGELIHDYYPCYRRYDREPGLYDIITDTFLPNAGTGTFGIGNKYEQIL